MSQVSVTITCGVQPANVVTMATKVLHNICNMYTPDLTDTCVCTRPEAYSPHAHAHTYQSNHLCTCYNHNMYVHFYNCYACQIVRRLKQKFINMCLKGIACIEHAPLVIQLRPVLYIIVMTIIVQLNLNLTFTCMLH